MRSVISNRIYIYNATKELYFWCRDNLIVQNPVYQTLMRLGKQDQIRIKHVPENMNLYVEKNITLSSGGFGDLVLPFGCIYAIWPMIKNYPVETKFNEVSAISVANDTPTQPLFPYQEEAVQNMMKAGSGILIGGTGSGKTNCGIEICRRTGKKFLWLTHTKDLVKQSYERFKSLYPHIQIGTVGDGKLEFGQDGTIATIQTMVTLDPDLYKNDFDVVMCDECFSGDTEILTSEGFKRFDKLSKNELIAQYENGQVSFVKPIRHINKQVNQYMSFQYKDINIITTLNHNMVGLNDDNKLTVRPAIDFLKGLTGYKFINQARICDDKTQVLSFMDRIKIMLQADGCLYYRSKSTTYDTYKLEFSKERKIKRFKYLCEKAGLEYKEYSKRIFSNSKWEDSIKFCIKMPRNENNYKILSDFLEQPKNSQYAMDILNEISEWDGHKNTKNERIEYDCVIKENAEFVQMCAFLANEKCSRLICIPRNGNHNTIYRVFYKEQTNWKYGRFAKQIINETINTYCVEVPSHKIVVKKDGFIFISGNCHHVAGSPELQKMFVKVVEKIAAKHKYGLTASKNRNDSLGKTMYATIGCNRSGEFAPVWEIKKSDTKTLTAEHIKVPLDTSFSYNMLNTDGSFNYLGLVDYLANCEERNKAILDKIEEVAADPERKQLVLCTRKAQCELLHQELLNRGIASELLIGKVSSKKREAILKEKVDWQVVVATVSLAKEGLDLPNLNTLHLASCIGNESDTIQSVGRIERFKENKPQPWVFDYVDVNIPYLISRYNKRVRWIRKRG